MDRTKYNEMSHKLKDMISKGELNGRKILLFGHCNATEELADLILNNGLEISAILDNNPSKHGLSYRDIPISPPEKSMDAEYKGAVVLIVTRFYEAMNRQLRDLGFLGDVIKLIDYNTYAEYSISTETISRKKDRLNLGRKIIEELKEKYPGCFRYCCGTW